MATNLNFKLKKSEFNKINSNLLDPLVSNSSSLIKLVYEDSNYYYVLISNDIEKLKEFRLKYDKT
jgi:hypothetical protein